MIKFKSFMLEMSNRDLNPKYRGTSTEILIKQSKDNRANSPAERNNLKREIKLRQNVTEEAGSAAPSNNTSLGPGMGSDNSLKTKKARLFKSMYRRLGTTKDQTKIGVKEEHSSAKYYLQPGGMWKKGADGRSEGMTKAELIAAGKGSKIV